MSPLTRGRQRLTIPANGTALLLIDVINDLAFDGAGPLVRAAEPMPLRLARLKRRVGHDAYMRGLRIYAPADVIVSNSAAQNDAALEQMRVVLKADIRPSLDLGIRTGARQRQEAT